MASTILWCSLLCYTAIQTVLSLCEILKWKMKTYGHYFPVVSKVVRTFESAYEIQRCDHSNTATKDYFLMVLFITLY